MTDASRTTVSRCDVCGEPATVFVSAKFAWGGDPKFGSFRSYRCAAHAADRVPPGARVEPLIRGPLQ